MKFLFGALTAFAAVVLGRLLSAPVTPRANPAVKHHGIRTVEEFSEGLARDQEIISSINDAVASKIIWFVAISGFVFLNAPKFVETISPAAPQPVELLLVVAPWAITAACGILAYVLLLEIVGKDKIYYIMKQHAVRAYLANASEVPHVPDVLSILNVDEDNEEVAKRKAAVDKLSPWGPRLENLTLILLLSSFVLSLVVVVIYAM